MRVSLFVHCFFPDHFYGTETYTLNLAKGLMYLGHEVTVVCGIFQGEPRSSAALSEYVYDGIQVISFDKNYVPHSRIAETYFQEDARPYLKRILDETKPDLIHVTHLVNHTGVLIEEAARADIPVVATLTDFFGICFNNKLEAADGSLCRGPNRLRSNCVACYLKASGHPLASRAKNNPFGWAGVGLGMRLASSLKLDPAGDGGAAVADLVARPDVLRTAYRNYDAMIAPSRFLLKAYQTNGFDRDKLHRSPFGVDIDRKAKPAKNPASPITIGYIGQIAPHKGVDLLIEAIRDVPPSQVELEIYGPDDQDPTYMSRLRERAKSNVTFKGTFDPSRMADVLSRFDLLAIPSTWYENSPLVLLNALASHTPVIVSDVEGLTEFIEEGVSGWSFKRSDVDDLRQLLERLLSTPALIRSNSSKTSYDRTTLSMTEDVFSVYERVLSKS